MTERPTCPECRQLYIGPDRLCGCCPHCHAVLGSEDDFDQYHAGSRCLTQRDQREGAA